MILFLHLFKRKSFYKVYLYQLSLHLTLFTCFLSIFFLFKKFYKINIVLFSIFYSASVLTRPLQLTAIDNGNLKNSLIEAMPIETTDFLKYAMYRLIVSPFNTFEAKVIFTLLLSLTSIIISFVKINNYLRKSNLQKKSANIIIFISSLLLVAISLPLYSIHLRQYIAFAFFLLLISLLINPNRYNDILVPTLNILIIGLHPVYVSSLLSILPITFKYFIRVDLIRKSSKSIYIILKKHKIKILTLSIIGIMFGYTIFTEIYVSILSRLPGFLEYSLIKEFSNVIELRVGFNYLIPYILLFIIIITSISSISKNKTSNEIFKLKSKDITMHLIFSFIIVFILLVIELSLPSAYSVGRIKSGLYPLLFLYLPLISSRSTNYIAFISCTAITILFSIASIYKDFPELYLYYR